MKKKKKKKKTLRNRAGGVPKNKVHLCIHIQSKSVYKMRDIVVFGTARANHCCVCCIGSWCVAIDGKKKKWKKTYFMYVRATPVDSEYSSPRNPRRCTPRTRESQHLRSSGVLVGAVCTIYSLVSFLLLPCRVIAVTGGHKSSNQD